MTTPQDPSTAAPADAATPAKAAGAAAPGKAAPPKSAAYKGEEIDAERGPGLGCFWIQISTLVFLLVLTPLSVTWGWPEWVSAVLLVLIILVLLFAGQTVIFLLRLVAAGRGEGRRRPLASSTPTVGDLENDATTSAGSPDQGMRE
jgi:hypothetical protein